MIAHYKKLIIRHNCCCYCYSILKNIADKLCSVYILYASGTLEPYARSGWPFRSTPCYSLLLLVVENVDDKSWPCTLNYNVIEMSGTPVILITCHFPP